MKGILGALFAVMLTAIIGIFTPSIAFADVSADSSAACPSLGRTGPVGAGATEVTIDAEPGNVITALCLVADAGDQSVHTTTVDRFESMTVSHPSGGAILHYVWSEEAVESPVAVVDDVDVVVPATDIKFISEVPAPKPVECGPRVALADTELLDYITRENGDIIVVSKYPETHVIMQDVRTYWPNEMVSCDPPTSVNECLNIEGYEDEVPAGMAQDDEGNCYPAAGVVPRTEEPKSTTPAKTAEPAAAVEAVKSVKEEKRQSDPSEYEAAAAYPTELAATGVSVSTVVLGVAGALMLVAGIFAVKLSGRRVAASNK